MHPEHRPVLIIAISLAAFAMSIPHVAHAGPDAPTYTLATGDWWKYAFQTTIQGFTLNGTVNKTLAGEQFINVQKRDYDSFRVTLSGSGNITGKLAGAPVTGSWTMTGDEYVSTLDLARIRSHASFQISAQIAPPLSQSSFSTVVVDTVNSPPAATLLFPLTVGDHWSIVVNSTTSTTTSYFPNPSPITNVTKTIGPLDSTVTSSSVVTVPAGSFDAYLVNTRVPSGATANYYSPEVENMIEIDDYNSTGAVTDRFSLSDYRAWPYSLAYNVIGNPPKYNIAIFQTNVPPYNNHDNGSFINFMVTGPEGLPGRGIILFSVQGNTTDLNLFIDDHPATFTITQNQTFYRIPFSFPLSTHKISFMYASVTLQSPLLQQYLLPIILGGIVIVAVAILVIILVVRKKPAEESEPLPFGIIPGSDYFQLSSFRLG